MKKAVNQANKQQEPLFYHLAVHQSFSTLPNLQAKPSLNIVQEMQSCYLPCGESNPGRGGESAES